MVIPEGLLKDLARLFIWFPLRWVIVAAPPGLDLALIRHLGRQYYYFSRAKVLELKRNISDVAGLFTEPLPLEQIVIKNLETHFMNQYLVFLFNKFNKSNIHKYHSFEGWDNLENALKSCQGCIIIHGHFGPAQLPLVHLPIKNLPVFQIGYHPQGNKLSHIGKTVQRIKINMEMHSEINIIMADSFLRPIFRLLKNNGIVMMTGDGVGGGRFIGKYRPVSFLSKRIIFPEGPASLAKRTGAILLPAFTVPTNGKRFKTVIEPPLNLLSNGYIEKDIEKNTQAFAAILERYVKIYPYHWHFWDEFEKGRLIS